MGALELEIRGFRGVLAADLDLTSPLTILAGPNEAGKSSIGAALAALLTCTPAGRDHRAESVVHHGAQVARAAFRVGTVQRAIDWPPAKLVGDTRRLPTASQAACGVLPLGSMDVKAWKSLLIKAFAIEPKLEDLLRALDALEPELDDAIGLSETLWEDIEADGWKAVEDRLRDSARSEKALWRRQTGEMWGSAKANALEPEIDDDALDVLKAECRDLTAQLEQAIADRANDERLAELEALAGTVDQRRATYDGEVAAMAEHKQSLAEAAELYPWALEGAVEAPCPHCGGVVVIAGFTAGTKVGLAQSAPAELTGDARQTIEDQVRALERECGLAVTAKQDAGERLREAEAAANQISNLAAPGGPVHDDAIDKLRADVATIEKRIARETAVREAGEVSARIARDLALADVVSPAGVRGECLSAGLEAINTQLAAICQSLGCAEVSIDQHFQVIRADSSGHHPMAYASRSGQWITRLALQILIAEADGSRMLIVDDADTIVDGQIRASIASTLFERGLAAVMIMATTDRKAVPQSSPPALRSYWVQAGKTEENVDHA